MGEYIDFEDNDSWADDDPDFANMSVIDEEEDELMNELNHSMGNIQIESEISNNILEQDFSFYNSI